MKSSLSRLPVLCAALAFLSLTGACAASKSVHGNIVANEDIAQIKPGESTRSDVLRLLGSPTTVAPFDADTWYYVGQKAEKHGIFDPNVTEERVLAVAFDAAGVVRRADLSEDGPRNIPLESRKTPTYGTQTSPVQEFFGNLGKFNPPEKGKK